MSDPKVTITPDQPHGEDMPDDAKASGEGVIEFDMPPTQQASSVETSEQALDPNEQKALEILKRTLNFRERNAEEAQRRRLADENTLIRDTATSITGVSMVSDPQDTRLLIAYHLPDFFDALPIPPGLDPSTKGALREEALTMLLKLGPQDDIERMLAMQMIASHMTTMDCFRRAIAPGVSPELTASARNQVPKMSRLFLDLERSYRLRRKQLGRAPRAETVNDPKALAQTLLGVFDVGGVTFNDNEPYS